MRTYFSGDRMNNAVRFYEFPLISPTKLRKHEMLLMNEHCYLIPKKEIGEAHLQMKESSSSQYSESGRVLAGHCTDRKREKAKDLILERILTHTNMKALEFIQMQEREPP